VAEGELFMKVLKAKVLKVINVRCRYDNLLETFGAEPMPAVGFGFGDAVIVELLKIHNLLPDKPTGTSMSLSGRSLCTMAQSSCGVLPGVDTVVFSLDEALRPAAMQASWKRYSIDRSFTPLLIEGGESSAGSWGDV
jgi:histidyl-tRNA synthetase